jgi:signal transduction histidine kinase
VGKFGQCCWLELHRGQWWANLPHSSLEIVGSIRDGSAVASVQRLLRRAVVVLGCAWWGAQALAAFGPLSQAPAQVVGLCLAANAAALVTFIATDRREVLLAVLSATALTVAAFSGPNATTPLVMVWLNQAVVTAGLLWMGRRAALLILMVTIGTVGAYVASTGGHLGSPEVTFQVAVGIATIALADGWSVAAIAGAMSHVAQRSDEADQTLRDVRSRALSRAAAEREWHRVTRLLHDNVINTLAAIRTLPSLSSELIRARCYIDLQYLHESSTRPASGTAELLDRLRRRAAVVGVRVSLQQSENRPLSRPVAEALDGAVTECLNNIAKHTAGRSAHIQLDAERMLITDTGPGISAAALGPGGRRSIVDRCQEVGIQVEMVPDKSGTRMSFRWPHHESARQYDVDTAPPQIESLTALMGVAAFRLAMIFALIGLASTVFGLGQTGSLTGMAGLILLGLLALWARRVSAGRGRGTWPAPVYICYAFLITVASGAGAPICSRVGNWWWGPIAGLCVCVAVVLIDARSISIAAALLGYLGGILWGLQRSFDTSPGCEREAAALALLDVVVVCAVVFARRSIGAEWAALTIRREETWRVSREAAIDDAAEIVRHTATGQAKRLAITILRQIAEGSLDPRSAEARRLCERAETSMRSLMSIPPSMGRAGQILAEFLMLGQSRGYDLTVSCAVESDSPHHLSPESENQIWEGLTTALGELDRRTPVALSTVVGRSSLVVLVSARVVSGWQGLGGDSQWTSESVGRTVVLCGEWVLE